MGREVRRVPADWQHPRYNENNAPYGSAVGQYIPMYDGGYAEAADEFMAMAKAEGLQAALDYLGSAPQSGDYMPSWPESECTHFMMYEDTSEGTPISPAGWLKTKRARSPEKLQVTRRG